MPEFLVFSDVSIEQLSELDNADVPTCRSLLESFLQITADDDEKKSLLIDIHFHAYKFCKQQTFSAEKTSTLLSIMRRVQKDSFSAFMSLEQSFNMFKKLLLQHSLHRPPYSIEVFTLADLKKVTDYVTNTFYRHYKLYLYAFTPKRELHLAPKAPLIDFSSFSIPPLVSAAEVNPKDFKDLEPYWDPEPLDEQEEHEASIHGSASAAELLPPAGAQGSKVQTYLDEQIAKLRQQFEEKMRLQEEDFNDKITAVESKLSSGAAAKKK